MSVFHILTVGFHRRLGCPLVFMSKIRAEQTRQPWGTCVAHADWRVRLWPTIQVHGRAGTPALRPSWSEPPFLDIHLCFPGSMQRSEFSNLLPSLASMGTHIRVPSQACCSLSQWGWWWGCHWSTLPERVPQPAVPASHRCPMELAATPSSLQLFCSG